MAKRESDPGDNVRQKGWLSARPGANANPAGQTGVQSLRFDGGHSYLLFVPANYQPVVPAPFAVLLHGAGGQAAHGIALLERFANEIGVILLAPKSFVHTWDVIASDYGKDIELINQALQYVFENHHIDRSRIAVGGFSDGASYALSLGIINGELFSHIIAFSPGFMAPTVQTGEPRIFISHGTDDQVLPIERCSRRIVPQLTQAGYQVLYKEFDGPHTIPPEITRAAVDWLLAET